MSNNPNQQGSLFGGSPSDYTPPKPQGLFGVPVQSGPTAPGLFGAPAPSIPGPGLFGAPAPSIPSSSLFGAPAPSIPGPGLFGAPTQMQYQGPNFGAPTQMQYQGPNFGAPTQMQYQGPNFGAPTSLSPLHELSTVAPESLSQEAQISLLERYIFLNKKQEFFDSLVQNSDTHSFMKLMDALNTHGLLMPADIKSEYERYVSTNNPRSKKIA
jgi:hypothetical protein